MMVNILNKISDYVRMLVFFNLIKNYNEHI